MLQNFTILFPLGIIIIAVALIAMATIYVRMFRKERSYLRGECYEDEYGRRVDQLRETIPLYGAVLLLGVIVVVINFVCCPT